LHSRLQALESDMIRSTFSTLNTHIPKKAMQNKNVCGNNARSWKTFQAIHKCAPTREEAMVGHNPPNQSAFTAMLPGVSRFKVFPIVRRCRKHELISQSRVKTRYDVPATRTSPVVKHVNKTM